MIYTIVYKETVEYSNDYEADSMDDAISEFRHDYINGDIELDMSDGTITDVETTIFEEDAPTTIRNFDLYET